MNIKDFLFPEPEHTANTSIGDSDQLLRYDVSVHEIEENEYYKDFGDKPTHWELRIQPMGAWLEEGEKPEWGKMGDSYEFKMARYTLEPTVEEFSQHIYDECWATINAMGWDAENDLKYLSDGNKFSIEYENIIPVHVYAFLKELHKDYTKTEDFLEDYELYKYRMYNNLKFIHGMINGYAGMFLKSFEVPIGRHFFNFLGIEIYTANLKECIYPEYCTPTHWDSVASKKVIVLKDGNAEWKVQDNEGNIYMQYCTYVKKL